MCVQTSRARDKHLSWESLNAPHKNQTCFTTKTQQTPRHRTTPSLPDAFVQNNKPGNALLSEKSDRTSSASKRYINLLIKSDVNYFHKCHNNKRCQRLHERNICPYFDSRHILLDGVNKSSKMYWFLFHRLFKSLHKCFCVQQPQKSIYIRLLNDIFPLE